MSKSTKGKLIAEPKLSDLGTKLPRYSIGVPGGKILFHTTSKNGFANAKELVRRWNAFEKDGLELDGVRTGRFSAEETK